MPFVPVLICFVSHVSRAPYQQATRVSQDGQQQNPALVTEGLPISDAYRLDEEVRPKMVLLVCSKAVQNDNSPCEILNEMITLNEVTTLH